MVSAYDCIVELMGLLSWNTLPIKVDGMAYRFYAPYVMDIKMTLDVKSRVILFIHRL